VPLLGDAEGDGVLGLGDDGAAEPALVSFAEDPGLLGRVVLAPELDVPLPEVADPMSPPEVACATRTPPSPGA
jgi:hypothetical protein